MVFDFSSAASPDAIAIRIIPNPGHHSAGRWYQEQGFGGLSAEVPQGGTKAGSPQALSIDGYEAIRDGRTVYVNAANIVNDTLYTNIYLISYNQEAETATQDIFGQILSHWKFNTNITGVGSCNLSAGKNCLSDVDCPADEYCTGPKAKIARDTVRLSRLAEIKTALEKYKEIQGHYPELSAGTYLPNISVSTWPSWSQTLGKVLNFSLPADAVNQLGDCPGYDQSTCWDEETKTFADPDTNNDIFELPAGSQALVYQIKKTGEDTQASVCGTMESPQAKQIAEYSCATYGITNSPPEFTGINLPTAYSGQPYTGYIEAKDQNGDQIIWEKFDSSPGLPWAFWPAPPTMADTAVASQKSIKADIAGATGSYDFTITINDQRADGQITKTFTIQTINQNLPTITQASDKQVIIGENLDFTIAAQETDHQYPLAFSVSGLPNNLNYEIKEGHNLRIYGQAIDQIQDYPISIIAKDIYDGASLPMDSTITINNHPPTISSPPITQAVGCNDYTYQIIASDPDNHNLEYLATGLPTGLNFNPITGKISGQPITLANTFPINITVRDEYYSYSDPLSQVNQNFTLNVSDDLFILTPPENATIYVFPSQVDDLAKLYHPNITFFGQATVSTAYPITRHLTNNPGWLVIDPPTGQIQGTPSNNTTDPNTYDITVTAANNCTISQSKNFILTVLANQWCGDNQTQIDFNEQCDDGQNHINTDQCTDQCAKTYCGDGAIQAPNGYSQTEQCDDGNSVNTDACLNSCQTAKCGDGAVQAGVEQCDDGNTINGDGCNTNTANCQHVCGDGNLDLGEQCDDGNTSDNDKCKNDCTYSYCGDGVIQMPNNGGQNEQCEGTNFNGASCVGFGYNCGSLACGNCVISYSGCCNHSCSSNGATQCLNSSTQQTCGDHNGDGCQEWGNNSNCAYGCGGSPGHCLTLTTYNPACYYGTHAIEYCSNGGASAFCSYKGAVTYYSWGYASTGSPVDICGTCCDNVNCDCYGFNYCQWISCLY